MSPASNFLTALLFCSAMVSRASNSFSMSQNEIGASRTKPGGMKVVCYYTNWSQYRFGPAKFLPEDIDVGLCTHINYAFAKITGGLLAPYEWNDESTPWSTGMYERVNDLKKKKPGLRTLLAVGGWNLASQPFSQMVASAASRQRFIQQAIVFLRKWKFDGLDVDWEYPSKRGGAPQDKERFTELMQELKAAFQNESSVTGHERLLLTAAVGAGKANIDAAYDVPALAKCVDWVNLMGYDLHGSWENVTGECSPLYGRRDDTPQRALLNQNWAVHYWLSKGMPASQLVLGMAFYGRTFTLANPANHSVNAPDTGPGQAGLYTRQQGFLAYYEIMSHLDKDNWTQVFDNQEKTYYAYSGNQWVGYDNEHSIAVKCQYIRKMGLAGAMVWSLALDDFSGTLNPGKKYPLLNVVNKYILQ